MKINNLIEKKRLELGLTNSQVAKLVGLSIHEYSDIEDDPDETLTVLPLKGLMKLCKVLEIDIFTLLREVNVLDKEYYDDVKENIPLNLIIKHKREQSGLTCEELGDKIGFYEQAIIDMETDPGYLESWPIEPILRVCKELGLSLYLVIKPGRLG